LYPAEFYLTPFASTPPKVNSVPYIAMLRENNIRTGFLESKQHDSLAAATGKIGL
jgi:hypothetical protein